MHGHQTAEMKHQVEQVLDSIRPYLAADGGDIELVSMDDGCVKVRLLGACAGCPSSQETLQFGVETAIKQSVPAITMVLAV